MRIFNLCICICFLTSTSFAQLGNLTKALGDKVDDMLDPKGGSNMPIPSIYEFDYEYVMNITDKNGTTAYTYYINSKDNVIAMKNVDKDEITIMLDDHERKNSMLYIEGNGNKGRTKMPYLDTRKFAEMISNKQENKSSIMATGNTKTIAGYECTEYKTEDKKNNGLIFLNNELEINEELIFAMQNSPMGGVAQSAMGSKPGLLMELQFQNKKKPEKNKLTFECVRLEKTDYKIFNDQYYVTGQ